MDNQQDLFEAPKIETKSVYLGEGISVEIPELSRLGKNDIAVLRVLRNDAWYSLEEIVEATGIKPTSASSHARDLRKARCGSFDVVSLRRHGTTYYKLLRTSNGKFSQGRGYSTTQGSFHYESFEANRKSRKGDNEENR